MATFKQFKNLDGDPVIINRDNITAVTLEILNRDSKHEKVRTCISLASGGYIKVKEPFNDVREWLIGQIT